MVAVSCAVARLVAAEAAGAGAGDGVAAAGWVGAALAEIAVSMVEWSSFEPYFPYRRKLAERDLHHVAMNGYLCAGFIPAPDLAQVENPRDGIQSLRERHVQIEGNHV